MTWRCLNCEAHKDMVRFESEIFTIEHAGIFVAWKFRGLSGLPIRPDLVLIYAKPDARTLQLVRLGSHSELFE